MILAPEARPFRSDGKNVGVLLSHGFTSTVQSVRTLAEPIAAAGYSVRAPLLPGHGTTWQDLNRTTWPEWFTHLRHELVELNNHCEQVVVYGQSLGGALVLRLAQEFPELVDKIILLNPAVLLDHPLEGVLPILCRLVPALPGVAGDIADPHAAEIAYTKTPLKAVSSMLDLFAEVRRDLPLVHQPILHFRSAQDHVVPKSSGTYVASRVTSSTYVDVHLPNSYHVATLDLDAQTIVDRSLDFLPNICEA